MSTKTMTKPQAEITDLQALSKSARADHNMENWLARQVFIEFEYGDQDPLAQEIVTDALLQFAEDRGRGLDRDLAKKRALRFINARLDSTVRCDGFLTPLQLHELGQKLHFVRPIPERTAPTKAQRRRSKKGPKVSRNRPGNDPLLATQIVPVGLDEMTYEV